MAEKLAESLRRRFDRLAVLETDSAVVDPRESRNMGRKTHGVFEG